MKKPCGCCTGIEIITPEQEANRPGLPALVYRAGTYATFFESMIARMSNLYLDVPVSEGSQILQRIYPLRQLTTRDPGDPSIALTDAWAIVADVLTFYQERVANEGFLRTAVERRSILELSRLIGYRLRPGVSASVYLAFTVSDGFNGVIPAGTRAQSIPGPGETPQFFETSDNIPARDVWNSLKPRLTRPQVITAPGKNPDGTPLETGADIIDTIYFQGISTNLNPGDALLIVLGDDTGEQVLRRIHAITTDPDNNRTEVVLEEAPPQFSGTTVSEVVTEALQSLLDQAAGEFAGNALANQVTAILQQVLDAITPDTSATAASTIVAGALPQLESRHDVAVKRRFTRLEPWIAQVITVVTALAQELPGLDIGGGRSPVVPSPLTEFTVSPLRNLFGIIGQLSLPPSVQPANTFRLQRSTAAAFSRQSDVAPRLLEAFHPAAAGMLYKAWSGVETPSREVKVYAMRARASLFGHNAPLRIKGIKGGTIQGYMEWPIAFSDGGTTIYSETNSTIWLDGSFDKITPGSWVVLTTPQSDDPSAMVTYNPVIARAANPDSGVSRSAYGVSAKATSIDLVQPNDPGSSINWIDRTKAVVASSFTDSSSDYAKDFAVIRTSSIFAQAEELTLTEEPLDTDIGGHTLELASLYDGLDSGRWLIVRGERTDIPDTTGVTASELVMISGVSQGTRAPLCASFPAGLTPFSQVIYTTEPNKYGDRLVVGFLSVDLSSLRAAVGTPAYANQQYCDQVELATGIYASAYVPSDAELNLIFADFAGMLVDPVTNVPYPGGQISTGEPQVFAWRISTEPVHTILTLANDLAYTYDTSTVVIYGNVVLATNGQTQGEVLGDGDGSQSLQKFQLHQSPLTYVSAPTPAGAESTLVVRVNDIEWLESDNLVALGPNDRGYITQTDDAGRTIVIMGNGAHGTRAPTGTANVKAVYRSGIGRSGNVQANQISQLATQPPGVKGVINLLSATGGADPDTRDEARKNAPYTVQALDRLVSVPDYGDFSRTFAGIAKASARRLTDGRRLLIHVTIAGKDDIPIDQNSDLYRNLLQSLRAGGDPFVPVRLSLRRLKLLVINARVKVQPLYAWETVAPSVRSALLNLYSFENRELGQSAFLSEAVSAVQSVEGVAYVDMRIFDSVPEGITAAKLAGLAGTLSLNDAVESELASFNQAATDESDRILPAELVMLSPDIPDTLILSEILQ